VPRDLDILIPTRDRPTELAATLAGLASSDIHSPTGVMISDQSQSKPACSYPAVAGMVRILAYRGFVIHTARNLPPRGMAEQRAFLLSHSRATYVLYLDDDVWLEPDAISRMRAAIEQLGCGLVGNAVHGLSFLDDVRPEQQVYQEWPGSPQPERVRPGKPAWDRAQLHSAANLAHLTGRLRLSNGQWRAYKIAWIGACVMFDRAKLHSCGGFDFWPQVPSNHCGEDVAAQLQVLERHGGAGIVPSGAFHLESETTVAHRTTRCYERVSLPPE
jgi:hypothetical protein